MLSISQKAKNALLAPSRYIKFKIEVYFDGEDNEPTDITKDVISFDTAEEVSPYTSLPFGGVSYNELSVVLDNMQQLYTISNTSSVYNGKLVANKKVVLTYLVEIEDDVFEEIPGGIFYTDAWSSDNEALTATLICYDKLALHGSKPVSRFKIKRGISFKDAYETLFSSAGVNKTDYIIDSNLVGTLDYFWCTEDNLNKCLDSLSIYTMSNVFVDRQDRIVVKPINSKNSSTMSISDNDIIYTSKSSPSYTNIYSGVNAKYNCINIQKDTLVYSVDNINVPIGETTIQNIIFSSSSPILHLSSIVLKSDSDVYIKSYSYTDKTLDLVIVNNRVDSTVASISVYGAVISQITNTLYVDRTTGTNNVMDIEIPFVCDASYAELYANTILDIYSRYSATITLDMRGYPPIELFDAITVNSPTSSTQGDFSVTNICNSFLEGLSSSLTVMIF